MMGSRLETHSYLFLFYSKLSDSEMPPWHAEQHFRLFFLFVFFPARMKQSNSWHNFKQRRDEPHPQEAVGAFGGALCVGIMLSRSLRGGVQRGEAVVF